MQLPNHINRVAPDWRCRVLFHWLRVWRVNIYGWAADLISLACISRPLKHLERGVYCGPERHELWCQNGARSRDWWMVWIGLEDHSALQIKLGFKSPEARRNVFGKFMGNNDQNAVQRFRISDEVVLSLPSHITLPYFSKFIALFSKQSICLSNVFERCLFLSKRLSPPFSGKFPQAFGRFMPIFFNFIWLFLFRDCTQLNQLRNKKS